MIKSAKRVILLFVLLFQVATLQGQDVPSKELLDWHRLPDLPDSIGVGGPCAGISNGALIVAGGAHFRTPFLQGGEKIWTDSIYVLASSFREWESGFTLARPMGYAVAAQWGDEVICAGGGNALEHFVEVIALRWEGQKISQRLLPALPQPRAFASGTVVGDTLYSVCPENACAPGLFRDIGVHFGSIRLIIGGAVVFETLVCAGFFCITGISYLLDTPLASARTSHLMFFLG